METNLYRTALLLFVLHAPLAHAASLAGVYQIDPAHSKVGFEIAHLVIASVEGRFGKFSGTIDLADDFQKTQIKGDVDVTSIDTGVADRDKHLKSADFFDAVKFPAMSFVSTGIVGSKESFKLNGNLTIHGVTKPVSFDAKFLGAVTDMMGATKLVFRASTKISRKEFGLLWSKVVEAGPVVGDEVAIDLKIEAALAAAKK